MVMDWHNVMYIVGIAADCSICHSSLLGEGIVVLLLIQLLILQIADFILICTFFLFRTSKWEIRLILFFFFLIFGSLCSRPDCLSWYDSFLAFIVEHLAMWNSRHRRLINIKKSHNICSIKPKLPVKWRQKGKCRAKSC